MSLLLLLLRLSPSSLASLARQCPYLSSLLLLTPKHVVLCVLPAPIRLSVCLTLSCTLFSLGASSSSPQRCGVLALFEHFGDDASGVWSSSHGVRVLAMEVFFLCSPFLPVVFVAHVAHSCHCAWRSASFRGAHVPTSNAQHRSYLMCLSQARGQQVTRRTMPGVLWLPSWGSLFSPLGLGGRSSCAVPAILSSRREVLILVITFPLPSLTASPSHASFAAQQSPSTSLLRAYTLASCCQNTRAQDKSSALFKLITSALRVADQPSPQAVMLSFFAKPAEVKCIERLKEDVLRCAFLYQLVLFFLTEISLPLSSLPPSPRPFATLHSLGLDLGVGVPDKVVVFWASNWEERARAIATLRQRCFMQVLFLLF